MRAGTKRIAISLLAALGISVGVGQRLQATDLSPSDLRIIDATSLPSFQADFNGEGDAIRLVLLLSPT